MGMSRPRMTVLSSNTWEFAASLFLIAALATLALWLLLHNRHTPEERERARRKFLAQSGRLVDGMLLDICEMPSRDGRTLVMMVYNYRIGGVDYECSQDVTTMGGVIDPAQVPAGFPCSVRYQPGSPHNSIILAEEWSGLRLGLTVLPEFQVPSAFDLHHFRPGRG